MKNKYLIVGIVVLVVLLIVSVAIPQKEKKKEKEKMLGISYDIEGNETSLDKYDTENPVVAMYIENYGSVVIELYPEIAPNTVNNFISLTKSCFYDNNTFQRLVRGFVIQGGDTDGIGSGGPDYTIKGEFSENGFENNLKHEKGIVSMARGTENDSAGSQFFIVLEKTEYLDGKYAAFGKVIDGFENVESIAKNEAIADTSTGKLRSNLKLKKTIIDLKGKTYPEVEKIS